MKATNIYIVVVSDLNDEGTVVLASEDREVADVLAGRMGGHVEEIILVGAD